MSQAEEPEATPKYFPWWLLSGALLSVAIFVVLWALERAPGAVSSLLTLWPLTIITYRQQVRGRLAETKGDATAAVTRRSRRIGAAVTASYLQLTVGSGLLLGFLTPRSLDLSLGQATLGGILLVAGAATFLGMYLRTRRRGSAVSKCGSRFSRAAQTDSSG